MAALRATPAAVCEAQYSSSPAKLGFMRVDTMAVMLGLANVAAYARVLVVETCGGLLTAAAAERLGGHGSVHSVWLGPKPPSWEVWRQCSLSAAARQAVKFVQLGQLLQLGGDLEAASAATAADDQLAAGSAARDDIQRAAVTVDVGGSFDSCLIAAPRIGAIELLRTLRPLLAPSASFVVYSPYAQPLGEALQVLRRSGQAVNLALQEGWWRELQVLPARTHPMMIMDHGGGLILSGTMRLQKAETGAEATAAGEGQAAKRQHVG